MPQPLLSPTESKSNVRQHGLTLTYHLKYLFHVNKKTLGAMVAHLIYPTNGFMKTTLQMKLALFTKLEDGLTVSVAVL